MGSWTGSPEGRTMIVLAGLATWRVSHLLVAEDGPADIVVRARALVDGTPLAGVMDCFGCTSLWVGPMAAAAVMRGRATPVETIVVGAGLSGAAYLVELLRRTGDAGHGPGGADAWVAEPVEESSLVRVTDQ